jgi:hypothetical protein
MIDVVAFSTEELAIEAKNGEEFPEDWEIQKIELFTESC